MSSLQVVALIFAPAIAWPYARLARVLLAPPGYRGLFAWALVSAEQVFIFVTGRMWTAAGVATAELAAALAVMWWRRRKDRKKALLAAGAKARARIAAMVTSMRERARPRPVLRPGLQGAR